MVATRSKSKVEDLAARSNRGTGPGSGQGGGGTGPSGPGPRPIPGTPLAGELTEYGRRIAAGARRPTPELLARLARILRTPAVAEAPAAVKPADLSKAA